MATIRCDIVSAESEIFQGTVTLVVASGEMGELGIAPRHAPLITRLKHLIVATLKLEDITPAQMADDEPLIGSGLNLDSIDALELVVTLEKEFGIKIASSEESRQALASVAHLAEFIRARADPARLPT